MMQITPKRKLLIEEIDAWQEIHKIPDDVFYGMATGATTRGGMRRLRNGGGMELKTIELIEYFLEHGEMSPDARKEGDGRLKG